MSNENETETSTNQQLLEKEGQIEYLRRQLAELTKKLRIRREGDDEDEEDDARTIYNERYYQPRGPFPPRDDIKVDIPEFFGKIDGDEFNEWVHTVERVFDYKETTDEKKVKIVALKLRKHASDWWENLCKKRARKGKEKIRTWEKMKKKMTEKFTPPTYLHDKFSNLHHFEQGNLSIPEYASEFENLIMKCDLREDDAQTLIRFLEGLNPNIKQVVELHPYNSFDELVQLAHKVERQQKAKGKGPPRPFTKTPFTSKPPFFQNHNKPLTIGPKTTPPQKPNQASQTTLKPPPKRCFKCQGLGHIAIDCPNTKVVSLMEYHESFEEELVEGD